MPISANIFVSAFEPHVSGAQLSLAAAGLFFLLSGVALGDAIGYVPASIVQTMERATNSIALPLAAAIRGEAELSGEPEVLSAAIAALPEFQDELTPFLESALAVQTVPLAPTVIAPEITLALEIVPAEIAGMQGENPLAFLHYFPDELIDTTIALEQAIGSAFVAVADQGAAAILAISDPGKWIGAANLQVTERLGR